MNKIKKFAPVLIITLNRDEHFINCVNSLSACMHADKTDLYLALDYPSKENHWEGYNKILEYLPAITGFNSVNVIRREHNYGIEKNYFDAVDFVFEKYDRLIFTEDDNLFSDDFLNFMNLCLEEYKNHKYIFSISGYNYPVNLDKIDSEVFIWSGHTGWGEGLWKSKWYILDWNIDHILSTIKTFIKGTNNILNFNSLANHYLNALITILEMKRGNGDGYITLFQYMNNMYTVFPKVSRVRNMGHDGSGSHCVKLEDNIFEKQNLYVGASDYKLPKELHIDNYVFKVLKTHFKRGHIYTIKSIMKVLLVNLGVKKV